ncbi:hypothetical protein ACDF64_01385 [Agromyces sp. MMS24-JH15]|uniref:hypothetical protein n=1 Tax=Agromyces sp. MMS24-JH15 TaxID=3243765 RepID=UPI003748643C
MPGTAQRWSRRPLVRGLAAAVALVAAAGLSGCAAATAAPSPPAGVDLEGFEGADGNGLWLVQGEDLAAEVLDAVRHAGPVHVAGAMTETVAPEDSLGEPTRGRTLALDYRGRADAFDAQVTAGDLQVRIVASAGGIRLQGDAAAVAAGSDPSLDAASGSSVICTVGSDPVLARWDPLLSPVDLLAALLGGGTLSVAEPAGDGDTLDVVVAGDDGPLGVLVVERFGPPLPRSFTAADGTGDGSFAFDSWGAAPDLAAAVESIPCPAG